MSDPFDLPPDVLRRVPLFAELAKVLSWSGGPLNWDLARQVAVSIAAGDEANKPLETGADTELAEHLRLAELWLGETTGLEPAGPTHAVAVTAVDWAERAAAAFADVIDPVAAKVSRALGDQMSDASSDMGPIAQALRQMAPMFMGIQAGSLLGTLAREILGTYEVPLPVTEGPSLVIIPAVDRLAVDHGLDRRSVRQWVAMQATAHSLTIDGTAWVRAHFFALYHNYVTTLDVTIAESIERLQQLDLSDPAGLQEALGDGGLFTHQATPDTAAAAARVASFLAVIEAYVTVAVETASSRLGPEAFKIAETFARRGAETGPGTRALIAFVGLEPRADRRRATAFAREVVARGGWEMLRLLFEDPDAFPSDLELSQPGDWMARVSAR